MREFCPHCMEQTNVILLEITTNITVREEPFEVFHNALVCKTCCNPFYNNQNPNTSHEKAYNLYRTKHILLSPEQIKNYRIALNYSYEKLYKKTGINPEKLELIESGALHDKDEDLLLRRILLKNKN